MTARLHNPYYQDNHVTIYHGDCRAILPQLVFDAIGRQLLDHLGRAVA